MKIMLTGGFGLVGSRILEVWDGKYEVVCVDLIDESSKYKNVKFAKGNITNKTEVADLVFDEKPDVIVHLAAHTDVEKAESERDLVWDINVNATRNLADAALDNKSYFIYISTGFIFDGKKESYLEDDEANPINYYGLTKMEGERTLQKSGVELAILRINYPYRGRWEKKSDTIRWMVENFKKGEKVTLVKDQHISPTFLDDLAQVLDKAIEKRPKDTFHVTGGDCLTFVEIGKIVANEFGFDKKLIGETSLEDFLLKSGRKAAQPLWSCLMVSKVEKELGVKMTPFIEGVKKVKESYSA